MFRIYKLFYEVYDIDNLVLASKQSKLVYVVEDTGIRTYSRKTNKLSSIYYISK